MDLFMFQWHFHLNKTRRGKKKSRKQGWKPSVVNFVAQKRFENKLRGRDGRVVLSHSEVQVLVTDSHSCQLLHRHGKRFAPSVGIQASSRGGQHSNYLSAGIFLFMLLCIDHIPLSLHRCLFSIFVSDLAWIQLVMYIAWMEPAIKY